MLRFKKNNATDFPNLEETTLGEVCNKIGDGLHSAPTYDVDGEYYFINGNNLKNGTIIITSDTKKVSKETFLKNDKGLDGHTILLSINGTIGNLAYYKNENVMLGKSAAYLKIKKSVDKEYIYQLLQTRKVKTSFLLSLTGTTIKNLGLEAINKTHIFIPVLEEQHKIADFLSSVDEIIRVQEEEITVLEEQKKGIMQKLFNCEVRFKADDGSEYPEWEERKWGSIGQFFKSGNLSKSDLSEEGTPCILYGELYTKYNEIADTIYSKTNVPCEVVSEKGDVIIPKSGETPEDISTASCIPYDGVALGGDLIIFRSNCILGTYLSYLISNKKKWEIAKIAQGKSIVHINEKSLAKIEFPCIAEQQKIVDCLSAYNEAIQVKKDKLEVWKEIKKGLLQQMFV